MLDKNTDIDLLTMVQGLDFHMTQYYILYNIVLHDTIYEMQSFQLTTNASIKQV